MMPVPEQIQKIVDLLTKDRWWSVLLAYLSTFVFVWLVIFGVFIEPLDLPTRLSIIETNGQFFFDRRVLHLALTALITSHLVLFIGWWLRRKRHSQAKTFEPLLRGLLDEIESNARNGIVSRGTGALKNVECLFEHDPVVTIDAGTTTEILRSRIDSWIGKLVDAEPGQMNEITEEAILAYVRISKKTGAAKESMKEIQKWENYCQGRTHLKHNVLHTLKLANIELQGDRPST